MHKELLEIIVKIFILAEKCKDKETFIKLQIILRDLNEIYKNL